MNFVLQLGVCFLLIGASFLTAEQKVVLISGGTGGIGQGAIQAFEEKGWKVWAGYRKTSQRALKNSDNIRWIPLDVTDDQEIAKCVQTLIEEEGRIDALINNAGYGLIALEETASIDEVHKLFDVNFFGSLKLIQQVVPHMQSQGFGHIINISSTSGVRALPGLGLYAASKFALEGLSEALSATLSPWNIQVAIIQPGTVQNDFAKHCALSKPDKAHPFAQKLSENLLNKLSTLSTTGQSCEEIGRLIVEVAETKKPNLRYQTSLKVEETVLKKLVDPSGNKLRDEQLLFLKTLIE
jgi:NADP-dependent 3-hydroxy acid dehydrogenase YdfG